VEIEFQESVLCGEGLGQALAALQLDVVPSQIQGGQGLRQLRAEKRSEEKKERGKKRRRRRR
jgi:hypothetical protein